MIVKMAMEIVAVTDSGTLVSNSLKNFTIPKWYTVLYFIQQKLRGAILYQNNVCSLTNECVPT